MFRFEDRPQTPQDMQRVSAVFAREWQALFPQILASADEIDATIWAQERDLDLPIDHEQALKITAVAYEDVRDKYTEMQRTTSPFGALVGIDVQLPEERLRLGHHIYRSESQGDVLRTDFYRGTAPGILVVGGVAPESIFKSTLSWCADIPVGEPLQLARQTFLEKAYGSNVVPVTSEDPDQLFRSFCESKPSAEEMQVYFDHGVYATTFDQLQNTLAIMRDLAGEDPARPWGN